MSVTFRRLSYVKFWIRYVILQPKHCPFQIISSIEIKKAINRDRNAVQKRQQHSDCPVQNLLGFCANNNRSSAMRGNNGRVRRMMWLQCQSVDATVNLAVPLSPTISHSHVTSRQMSACRTECHRQNHAIHGPTTDWPANALRFVQRNDWPLAAAETYHASEPLHYLVWSLIHKQADRYIKHNNSNKTTFFIPTSSTLQLLQQKPQN